ncbi:hypothetical protein TCON_1712 [Astathelohania contejeani]|uniref:Mechanosensitive ion channel MscS domain-containing protein n=1 Tax=Astathelohania contejeani TaxID=164912 RepID=A0ABQ7HY26_9MICR|nr:hypothetical protein TCON_1712 [Thelohania contejeani]
MFKISNFFSKKKKENNFIPLISIHPFVHTASVINPISLPFNRDIITNMFKGFYILSFRPFESGDVIKIEDKQGTVMDMDIHYIKMSGKGNNIIYYPTCRAYSNIIEIFKK